MFFVGDVWGGNDNDVICIHIYLYTYRYIRIYIYIYIFPTYAYDEITLVVSHMSDSLYKYDHMYIIIM